MAKANIFLSSNKLSANQDKALAAAIKGRVIEFSVDDPDLDLDGKFVDTKKFTVGLWDTLVDNNGVLKQAKISVPLLFHQEMVDVHAHKNVSIILCLPRFDNLQRVVNPCFGHALDYGALVHDGGQEPTQVVYRAAHHDRRVEGEAVGLDRCLEVLIEGGQVAPADALEREEAVVLQDPPREASRCV